MPIFQYSNYTNPYGPSIAEALGDQGAIQAAGALRAGDIEANAIAREGMLRGQMLGQIGNAFTAIPQYLQQQREAARKDEIQQMQLDALRRDNKSRLAFEAALRNPANYNEDGTVNDAAVTKELQTQDVGAWQQWAKISQDNRKAALDYQNTVMNIAKSGAEIQEKQGAVRKAQQDYLGNAALSAYGALQTKPDDPLHARDTALAFVARGIADGAISQDAGRQFLLSGAAANPDQLGATFLQFVSPELKAKIDKEQAEAKKAQFEAQPKPINVPPENTLYAPPLMGPDGKWTPGQVLIQGGPKQANAGSLQDAVERARRMAVQQNGGVPLTDAQIQAVDAKAMQTYKEQNADPEMRAAALAQKNLAMALTQMQLNQAPTKEQAASVAEDLVAHRISPDQLASLFSTRGKEGLAFKLAVTSEAKKLDPQFNFEEAAANYQLVKSPQFQNTVRYMDSVAESLPRLQAAATTLNNGSVRSINELVNAGKNQFNNVDLKRFNTDRVLVGDEVAKILSGGGTGSATSDAKLKQGMDLLNQSDNPAAIATAVQEIQALIGYRRRALTRGTYMEGLTPGGAPTGSSTPAPTAGGYAVRLPNGDVKYFPSQAAADGFKRAAGIP
jgi:hypothetical protein